MIDYNSTISEQQEVVEKKENEFDDLFSNTIDLLYSNNCGCDEKDVLSFCQEDIHYEEYDKYLVPMFAKEYGELKFRGNGVIVGNYLISAAHVTQSDDKCVDYSKMFFKYGRVYRKVSDRCAI